MDRLGREADSGDGGGSRDWRDEEADWEEEDDEKWDEGDGGAGAGNAE